jgi:hypothetical protein
VPRPGSQQDLRHRGCGGSRGHDPDVFEPLADDTERVDEGRQDDDRRPVLVIVEDRDVELVAQALLDLEATRCGMSQIDPAEPGAIASTVATIVSTSFVARQSGRRPRRRSP